MEFTPLKEIPGIVESTRACFRAGVTRSYEWRMSQIEAIYRMMSEQEEAIIDALYTDLRRPRYVAL